MMKNTDSETIVIPTSFRYACELFGIAIPDFLQLYVNHFSYMDQNFHDHSVYNLVTKSFEYVRQEDEGQNQVLQIKLNKEDQDKGVKLIQSQIKLSINKNYSNAQKRSKGKLLTHRLYDIFSKGLELKEVIYLDEENTITLNKDLLFKSILTGISVTQFLNRIMECVAIPEHLARLHLNKAVYNPVLGVYMRVYDGYGHICDQQYQKSPKCRLLIMEIQELDKRYFFCRDLQQRTVFYQEWLDHYVKINASVY
ncbi:hypothetical protein BN1088_1430368 [Sphingobacterium sp. PM2-P1-29]|nr:hypothetical protein BN1088_1430368 [Sphingobacterium sp. PM2-P1-29]